MINVPPPASRDGRDAWLSKTGQSTTAPVNRAFPAAVKLESEAELDGGDTIEAHRAAVCVWITSNVRGEALNYLGSLKLARRVERGILTRDKIEVAKKIASFSRILEVIAEV